MGHAGTTTAQVRAWGPSRKWAQEEEQDHRAAGELESLGLGLQGGGGEEGEVREVINEPGEAETGPVRGGKDSRLSLGGGWSV